MSDPSVASAFACAFIGDDSLLIRCVELARKRGHAVRCVITTSPSIVRWAQAEGIAALDAGGDYVPAFTELVGGERIGFLFSVANLRAVPPAILQLATKGGVNFHDGPLPRFGGVHAPAWALMAGARAYGITWHQMTERMDAGAIILQRAVALDEDDTSLTLNLKCFQAGAESFGELLDALAGTHLRTQKHELDRATYHTKRDRVPGAATLDWTRSSRDLIATVRALDFGSYRNTLGAAKVAMPKALMIVRSARAVSEESSGPPGTVVWADANGIVVSTGRGDVLLESFATLDGVPTASADAAARGGVLVGQRLPHVEAEVRAKVTAADRESASYEEFWVQRLTAQDPLELPQLVAADTGPAQPDASRSWQWLRAVPLPEAQRAEQRQIAALAGVCAWLGHVTARSSYDVSIVVAAAERTTRGIEPWFMESVPLHVELDAVDFSTFAERLAGSIRQLVKAGIPLRDLIARAPSLRSHCSSSPVAVVLADSPDDVVVPEHCVLVFAIDGRGGIHIGFDPRAVDAQALRSFDGQLSALVAAARSGTPVDRLSLLDHASRQLLFDAMAGEVVALDSHVTICSLFADQVGRTPDAIAVIGTDRQLTYQELARESDRLALRLRALGVGPDVLVGIYMHRSADLLVAVLGILKAGGAYLPLDPAYPADRLRYMIADSETPVIVTSGALASSIPAGSPLVLKIEDGLEAAVEESADERTLLPEVRPPALAYVIYTSGSTGAPKGVMIEHRNVTSFFTAMDRLLGTKPVKWLALTSLSFDISVLELLWPLTHGSTVVVHSERIHERASAPQVAFSLYYFSADERASGADKYRLLLEGAKFADRHGFAAVWTPERHFHEFGGIFPNPSVTSAAVAAITKRVAIRAGSVVLPLHHPLRIAEEWSVVDNLSNGRVGISFASGWRPEDFVLRPEGFKDAKKRMIEGIETVRRLWRGESLPFDGPDGKPVQVAIHPRPVQAELPVFITAAGSPDTFTAAGKAGAGVLTHLLGQTLEELKEKIDIYRVARRAAGHTGPGHVALMLHTFVGADDEDVKDTVRGPMKGYLRTSVSLIEKNAQAFPTFKKRADGSMPKLDFASLSESEADALLEYSFERYFDTSGLFGTVDRCAAMTEQLAAIGVDEIACLIDFGVDPELALSHLEHLDRVRARFEAPAAAAIPQLLRDHGVTHMQCTPSQALLLLADGSARESLSQLEALLVGGEAMPPTLAQSLRELGVRRLVNMYGPTETTVWSTSHEVSRETGSVPIGRPIANTFVRVVGLGGSIVPPGVPGELWIGGPGVTRGYLKNADLTNERFVHGGDQALGRMYRTGDQVRLNALNELVFLGRGDNQVKVRGYRIELGEIERALGRQSGVNGAVVVARGDQPNDRRLVGYVSLRGELANASSTLREGLRSSLPEFMIPSQIIVLTEFPRTPNGKIDRKRLPSPDTSMPASASDSVTAMTQGSSVAPASIATPHETADSVVSADLLQTISAIWRDVLQVATVGLDENFFDVGGHSLLAVQVHQRVRKAIGRDFPITDLFRYSTIRTLASHLGGRDREDNSAAGRGTGRAAQRREAQQRRQPPLDR